ncbi:MAG: hypothetical protein PHG20_07160 [Geobacteraceae bacterium]|nr:hypothetical protein [Geobacteraceae bacterium]
MRKMMQDQKFLPVLHPRGIHRFIAFLTAIIFTFSVLAWSPKALEANMSGPMQMSGPFEALPLSHTKWISKTEVFIPAELGTVEYSSQGKGPAIFHIQTAHGHYEAQKQIQAILHYLEEADGVKTLLVEGSAFELNPELIRFFPKDRALTMKAADELAKRALLKGPELYLLEADGAKAYGIEEIESYRWNGFSFVNVLKEKEKAREFLSNMDNGIERLSSHYLNKDLRDFLKHLEALERSQTSFWDSLTYLKTQSSRYLDMDLDDVGHQIDWPMLVRVFKMHELSGKLDRQTFQKEKESFLKAIRSISDQTYSGIKNLLIAPDTSHAMPYPGTSDLFEDMIRQLPRDFSYEAFPNVKHFIGCLLLQSELKAPLLMGEAQRLTEKVTRKLVQNQNEQKLIEILKDYHLLRKLFALELLPADYETLLARQGGLHPSALLPRFLSINTAKRVKNVEFDHIEQLDELFNAAMQFYAGVKERDGAMERRIEERLKQTGADKVAVITGGFHADPFRDYFASKGFSYALITPKLGGLDEKGHENYVRNMLRFTSSPVNESTRETVFLSDAKVMTGNIYGVDRDALRSEVRKIITEVTANKTEMTASRLREVENTSMASKTPSERLSIADNRAGRAFGRMGTALGLAAVFGILTVISANATDYQITPTPGLTQTNLTNPKIETVQPVGPAIVPVISKNEVQVSSNMGSDTNTIKGLVMALSSPQNFSGTNIVFGFSRQFAGNTASLRLKDAAGRISTNRVRVINVNSSSQFYQVAASKFEGGLDLTKITEMTILFDQPLDPQVLFASWNVLLGGIGQLPSRITKIRDLGTGGIELTFTTQIGGSYEAEQSSDLRSSSWSTVSDTAVNPNATEATVIIPKTTIPQFMRIRTNPRSELRLTVAEERPESSPAVTFVENISWEERILIREYYPGILTLSLYEAAIRNGRAFAVNTASMILERSVYAEGIASPLETKALSIADRPESFKNFPLFGLARGILLATETGKIADGLILSRKFAFDRRGAIAAARTVLGDVPLAVIVPINSGKEIAFIKDLNAKLAKANRPEIFLAHTAEAALRYLRSRRATRLKALFDVSEKNDPLAVALRNQLPEIAFVNDEMFRSFIGYAGAEVERLVAEIQARFAFARAA